MRPVCLNKSQWNSIYLVFNKYLTMFRKYALCKTHTQIVPVECFQTGQHILNMVRWKSILQFSITLVVRLWTTWSQKWVSLDGEHCKPRAMQTASKTERIQQPRGNRSTSLTFRKPWTREVWSGTYSVTSLITMQGSGWGTVGEEGCEGEDVDAWSQQKTTYKRWKTETKWY